MLTENQARAIRVNMLQSSDWTQIQDNELTAQERSEWAVYRQLLRNVPLQEGFPGNIVWPRAPDKSRDAGNETGETS